MFNLKLCGWLGKKYGKMFRIKGSTVKDGIDMLSANFKEFRTDFVSHGKLYKIVIEDEQLDEQMSLHSSIKGKTVRIIPYFGGSGNAARVVAGIILIAVSPYTGAASGTVASMGWSLVIGGAIGLLFGTNPKTNTNSEDSSRTSYLFGGTVNTTGQGNPVPILYGRRRIGSQVISAGITSVTN